MEKNEINRDSYNTEVVTWWFKILCPYCSSPYDAEMLTQFDYCCGSEWTWIYWEEIKVEINCTNCKKLVYKKN